MDILLVAQPIVLMVGATWLIKTLVLAALRRGVYCAAEVTSNTGDEAGGFDPALAALVAAAAGAAFNSADDGASPAGSDGHRHHAPLHHDQMPQAASGDGPIGHGSGPSSDPSASSLDTGSAAWDGGSSGWDAGGSTDTGSCSGNDASI